MAYQRAQWHSGLTYQQICETCRTPVRYTDKELDFRPWYPDGYVDCPVCKNHLRHNEKYAMDVPQYRQPVSVGNTEVRDAGDCKAAYCSQCGNKFGENHRFCVRCGAKRD